MNPKFSLRLINFSLPPNTPLHRTGITFKNVISFQQTSLQGEGGEGGERGEVRWVVDASLHINSALLSLLENHMPDQNIFGINH